MKSIVELNSGERKKHIFTKVLVVIFIGILLAGSIFFIDKNSTPKKYKFILGGEEMTEIVACENTWHYENISGFIPCIINGTVGGLAPDTINWTISPQENCAIYGGEFTGLNAYNDTRAKELYDLLLPKCWTFTQSEISNEWIESSKCVCLDHCGDKCFEGNYTFKKNCESYNCGGGLILKNYQ